MVSNSQIMDGQRQQYLPGPPPPPSNQNTMSHLPPPPPPPSRSFQGSAIPPPPPGLPPGTVYGLPGGWQQSWQRPSIGQTLPPPPPMNPNAQLGYGMNQQRPGQINIPPPPPMRDEMPVLSATFIPGGDSFGPGVGIPPLDDYSTYSRYDGYDPAAYADPSFNENHTYSSRQSPAGGEVANRDNRAASTSSNRTPAPLALQKTAEAISPGPPTATLQNPNPTSGRQRAQSAMVSQTSSNDLAQQWPLERILIWLAANGFSNDWRETFSQLKLEKAEFLDLARGPSSRPNLAKLHKDIYPALAIICTRNNTGWDQSRERAEGKRLIKLISRLTDGDGPGSAGSGHRRQGSGVTSASTDGNVENSPYVGAVTTPSTAGADSSPGRPNFGITFPTRSAQERSATLPVFGKQGSSTSTPVESHHADSFGQQNRSEYTKNTLNGIAGRGRHSPNLSSDSTRHFDPSPQGSPALGKSVPAQVQSNPNLPLHSKTNSAESFHKITGFHRNTGPGNIVTTEVPTSGRFYENRREGSDAVRPENIRAYSNENAQVGKDHGKGFLSKFMRGKRHDSTLPVVDDTALESPTSPGNFREMLPKFPFSKSAANASDPALMQRPSSASVVLENNSGLSTARKSGRQPRRYALVTQDKWNYRMVDITEVESGASLRTLICQELGYGDLEYPIYSTELGKDEHEEPLSDSLLDLARGTADAIGSLKLFVLSPPLSAVSMPSTTGLGLTSYREVIGSSQAMQKSNSTEGSNTLESTNGDALQKRAEEWKRETEKKQKAYFESRQIRIDSNRSGNQVIDFDSPRLSPFEEKKTDTLVPHRRPPAAPSESNTLTKVNSLRTKPDHRSKSSMDALKRISDPISEDGTNKGRSKTSASPAKGIGAALASTMKVAAAPASVGSTGPNALGQHRAYSSPEAGYSRNSKGESPRPSVTWGKGNLLFKIPDYEEGDQNRAPTKPQASGVQSLRRPDPSPNVSPSTEHAPRPLFARSKSHGPDIEFKETNVAFTSSPNPQPLSNDDDDDSDDGLFAIPLSNKSLPAKKPALTVDTDQHPGKPKTVAFKSPGSSGTGSSAPHTGGDGSAGASDKSSYDQRSFSGGSAGWDSAHSPDETRARPDSFYSDIWANRPAVENVVDHLDKFFPGVDLDKPYLEESRDNASPKGANDQNPMEGIASRLGKGVTFGTQGLPLDFEKRKNDSDTLGSDESTLRAANRDKVASVASRQVNKSGGLGRMKSIREVAQKRNDVARGPSVSYRQPQTQNTGNLMRRKSTKMFGANIVQIKPQRGSNRLSTLDPIPQEDIPSEETPKRQATFKIIRGQLIGKGTYGRVYLGMNATTGEFLAVKQVEVNQKAAAQDKDRIKEMVAALDVEIDTMQHLEHPNIVQYLGCERQEFSISIYLEYISGGSVGSCLRKHGKFEESVVRSLTQQTLRALAYLHQEGILHRDLKADNILLDLDGTCKISDFGISKKSDNIYGNDITNSMQGSVFWMAPEVVRSQGQGYSAKVDIWSLGCVVLEMFAGKRPWSREEAIGAIFKLGSLQQAPPIPEDVSATASVDGLNFMYDCFQVNPSDRPTAKTLLQHSTFCVSDPYYNFFDTDLAAKLRNANLMPGE